MLPRRIVVKATPKLDENYRAVIYSRPDDNREKWKEMASVRADVLPHGDDQRCFFIFNPFEVRGSAIDGCYYIFKVTFFYGGGDINANTEGVNVGEVYTTRFRLVTIPIDYAPSESEANECFIMLRRSSPPPVPRLISK